eukprot:gnl/Spiro4/26080_TR13005_c0_g1_i1.p2 gnl/Spiro4/26080_TR13005_c0_g1~~gnl/Spiro4/26080_TR13005_c0_g1_i1.p2  ORF type:complete len:437 (+),score=102.39 gnl/Spiro4/26080_TR13005_c0_g1_i1:112-1311(+)
MGYAGNCEPSLIIPSCIALNEQTSTAPGRRAGFDDLEFYIGNEAVARQRLYDVKQLLVEGQVQNWDYMERYWQRSMFDYLKCNPENHYVLLTEPPLNTPENREYTAEIMFETFNVPGLYIAVQAVLALAASWTSRGAEKVLTGTVVDSGDGVTHVIPVSDGHVISSCIRSIPLAGRTITSFIQTLLRERETQGSACVIPSDEQAEVARSIKEKYSYVCKDLAEEYAKFDADPSNFKRYEGVHARTGQRYACDVGYEMFLGPEVFFHPEIHSGDHTVPLPVVIDSTIQQSPIDARRGLYKNIVLSGGTTMLKNFNRRLQVDLRNIVKNRLRMVEERSGMKPTPIETNVVRHHYQQYAVWLGGSLLAATDEFYSVAKTKAQYEEFGPSCMRHSAVFTGISL